MAIDHFETHKFQAGRTDWNFNILLNDQPQVTTLAKQYEPLLQHPGLYKPVPGEWLHATVLRVGFLEDFTEAEMHKVVELLEPRLVRIVMPELMLGQWWLWGGNPVLHITPDEQLQQIFRELVAALKEVVGEDHMPQKLQFIPHITLAYSKTYDDELGLYKKLQENPIPGIPVHAKKLSLIKQWIEDDYYRWDIVKEIELCQTNDT